MNSLEIGITTITYDEQGLTTTASFKPTMELPVDVTKLDQMLRSEVPAGTAERIKKQSDLVFGGWFSKMNEIELRDIETHEVVSEIVECLKWPNGNTKKCVMNYFYREIQK